VAAALAAAWNSAGAAPRSPGDSPAQSWFWSFPVSGSSSGKEARGPEWFWSFKPFDERKHRHSGNHFLTFAGTDLWRQGAFLYGGGLWAPAGMDHDGFVLKVVATRGYYRYRTGTLGDVTVIGAMYAASVMPGLHFPRGKVSVTVYAGPERQVHVLLPDDQGNLTRGLRTGVRLATDLWYQPTDLAMVTFSSTLTTIGNAYAMRSAFGWKLLDSFYLGPEALIYGANNYTQLRIGVHVTEFEFLRRDWQAAIGYAHDNGGNDGAYVRVGVSERW
jgi:hypothetical protein